MVGDYKQAIFGFQGTDPKEFEQFRARVASRAGACCDAADEAEARARALPRPVDRRQLPLVAGDPRGGRRADRRGRPSRRWACARRPIRTALISLTAPAGSSCGRPSSRELADGGRRRRRGGLDRRAGAASTPTRIARQVKQLARRGAGHGDDQAGRSRAGDILILVRSRGELASLIVARLYAEGVPVAGIDRLHLSQAAGGQGPARRDRLRRPAARRSQPRQPAGLAAVRLEPGPALRARLRPQGQAVAELADPPRGAAALGRSACHPVGLAGHGRLRHAGTLPRDHPVRPARRPAQAASAARRGGARPDRGTVSPARSSSSRRKSPRSTASSPGSAAATSRSCAIRPRRRTRSG